MHISQLANRYVKSPHDVVSVSDVVTVWVMGVDQERKRVSLTMVKPGTERHRGPRGRPAWWRPGGEPRDPNREREGAAGHRARGVAVAPAADVGRVRPARALTSPPVGAPSVAVLAETPARRPDRDHGRGPGPRSRRRPARRRGIRAAHRLRHGLAGRTGSRWRSASARGPSSRPGGGRPGASIAIAIQDRGAAHGRPAGPPDPAHRLPHSPRMPWPATSRSGPSASSSSSGKRAIEGPGVSRCPSVGRRAARGSRHTAQDQPPHPSRNPPIRTSTPVTPAEPEPPSNPQLSSPRMPLETGTIHLPSHGDLCESS